MSIDRIAAFSIDGKGGNPAGVMFCEDMLADSEMFRIAAEVGYSETAFLVKQGDSFRIRYFAPELEVPFCGHATIASGSALGNKFGSGTYNLILNNGKIDVTVDAKPNGQNRVSFVSPKTSSSDASREIIRKTLELFNLKESDLNTEFPVKYCSTGANHIVIVLNERQKLSEMNYAFDETKSFMLENKLATINLLWNESLSVFHSRNAFASGGVYEDPATGSAAAALSGYLRDIGWKGSKKLEIVQGEDMGIKCRIGVSYSDDLEKGATLSGEASIIID